MIIKSTCEGLYSIYSIYELLYFFYKGKRINKLNKVFLKNTQTAPIFIFISYIIDTIIVH